jgi:transposase
MRYIMLPDCTKSSLCLTLRDKLGTIFRDEDFTDLFPLDGQPALPPWRLALVTILQFRENLSDRQAAEAVRARIDWKYLLGLELTDCGFDFSVLCEFRKRLVEGEKEAMLLDKLLERCRKLGLVKARGKQRTDATHILAAIRFLNRLELLGETMRAALNEIATVEPDWLGEVAPAEWYERYGRRIEDEKLPQGKEKRNTYAELIGEDGFKLLGLLKTSGAPKGLNKLPKAQTLIKVWERHYKREKGRVRIRPGGELNRDVEEIVSPYDTEARFRRRYAKQWIGYMVNLSESCDDESVHLITHVETTDATASEANMTETIHQALCDKSLPPDEHLVDTAYVDAELLVNSQEQFDISLVGPGRPDSSWQARGRLRPLPIRDRLGEQAGLLSPG